MRTGERERERERERKDSGIQKNGKTEKRGKKIYGTEREEGQEAIRAPRDKSPVCVSSLVTSCSTYLAVVILNLCKYLSNIQTNGYEYGERGDSSLSLSLSLPSPKERKEKSGRAARAEEGESMRKGEKEAAQKRRDKDMGENHSWFPREPFPSAELYFSRANRSHTCLASTFFPSLPSYSSSSSSTPLPLFQFARVLSFGGFLFEGSRHPAGSVY